MTYQEKRQKVIENYKKKPSQKESMFNWFKKGDDSQVEEKISKINEHLKNSFNLVKKDMNEIGEWIKELHEKHTTHSSKVEGHEKRLQIMERRLEEIYTLLESKEELRPEVKENLPEEEDEEEFNFNQFAKAFSSLRGTEKEVFKKLAKLAREKGKNVHLKDLAAEVYVGKDYEKVRTALANHITALEIFDFVYRQRVGREVYIGLTENGKDFVKKIDVEVKKSNKKIVSRSKLR